MDMQIEQVPSVRDTLAAITKVTGKTFPQQTIGEIPLPTNILPSLFGALEGEEEPLFVRRVSDETESMIQANLGFLPDTATTRDFLLFLTMLYGEGSDMVTPLNSGKWLMDETNSLLISGFQHQALPKSLTIGQDYYLDLIRKRDSFNCNFKNFDGNPLDYDGMIGNPTGYTMPNPVRSPMVISRDNGNLIQLPSEDVTMTMNLSHTQNVVAGQVIGVTGTVPNGTPDGKPVHVRINGMDNGTFTNKTTFSVGGEYEHYFAFKEPGVYTIQSVLHLGTFGPSIQVSPTQELVIFPPIQQVTSLYFNDIFYPGVDEEVEIDGLIAGGENGYWDVSNPLFGATYSIADTTIARINDGKILALRAGTTTIRANYKGMSTTTDVVVTNFVQ